MRINFTDERWESIKENYGLWWRGKLGRPLISLTVNGEETNLPEPEIPRLSFHAHHGLSVPVEKILTGLEYDFSRQSFLGDSFPQFHPNFGPGVIAAFLGCELKADEHTCWFQPTEIRELRDLHFSSAQAAGNQWFQRIKEFCRKGVERWQGQVQIGMTDLGGNLDILSSFRPSENLLLDLYDCPDEVQRLTWEAHEAWWQCFTWLNQEMQPWNPGYTAWTPIFSENSYYMLQCDFCYMISPEMFDQFVKPELEASCRRLDNAFYHLDGPGQLPHLDSLLSIPELKGVQWVPGAGQSEVEHWPEVYRKIQQAGKKIQVFTGQCEDWTTFLDTLQKQIGELDNVILIGGITPAEKETAERLLKHYGNGR